MQVCVAIDFLEISNEKAKLFNLKWLLKVVDIK